MWLTKNEKSVLKLLLENSRFSDVFIAEKLKVSSQAVGKIRKSLEEEGIIESYTTRLNSKKLGVNLFVTAKAILINDKKIKETEEMIMGLDNVIVFIRTMHGDNSYFITLGFRGLEEAEEFLNTNSDLRSNLLIKEALFYSQKDVLKNTAKDLLKTMIGSSSKVKNNYLENDTPDNNQVE